MKIPLRHCPFCGADGVYLEHGYGDDVCSVGCVNVSCAANPIVSERPEVKPWNEKQETFYVLWEEAEERAAKKWNTRFD